MTRITDKLEELMELGGTKKDIAFLVISGLALIVSIFDLIPLPFDAAWIAIILCGIPIIARPSSALSQPSISRPTYLSRWPL